jgi:transcriptional regulator with XRE-family HTH domain
MNPTQCRAARDLLNWSQSYLARQSLISIISIENFEAGKTRPKLATLSAVKTALEAAGIEFIEGNGGGPVVRLRKS